MLKYPMFTTFSAHTKKAGKNRRGQDEVFGRIVTILSPKSSLVKNTIVTILSPKSSLVKINVVTILSPKSSLVKITVDTILHPNQA